MAVGSDFLFRLPRTGMGRPDCAVWVVDRRSIRARFFQITGTSLYCRTGRTPGRGFDLSHLGRASPDDFAVVHQYFLICPAWKKWRGTAHAPLMVADTADAGLGESACRLRRWTGAHPRGVGGNTARACTRSFVKRGSPSRDAPSCTPLRRVHGSGSVESQRHPSPELPNRDTPLPRAADVHFRVGVTGFSPGPLPALPGNSLSDVYRNGSFWKAAKAPRPLTAGGHGVRRDAFHSSHPHLRAGVCTEPGRARLRDREGSDLGLLGGCARP